MNSNIIISLVTCTGSILGACLTYFFTKKHQLAMEWRKEKINHYRQLLSSISDLAIDGTNKKDANLKFASASNTIALVAPQGVVNALMEFHDEVKHSNPNPTVKKHDYLLKRLLLEIRKDIKLSGKDDDKIFNFHLVGSAPRGK